MFTDEELQALVLGLRLTVDHADLAARLAQRGCRPNGYRPLLSEYAATKLGS